ncbi:hypothetical protein GINT2_001938 [Glugoides intestinalis]
MSVIALIFGIDRKPIFNGLDEGIILKRFEKLLQAVAAPGMSVEIENTDPKKLDSSKVSFKINSRSHSRTEFFGKVLITFSYKDDRENESRTTMSIKHKESHTAFNFVENNSKEIDMSNEIERLGNSSGFKEFSFPSMISRVFLMAGNNPLPKGNVLEDMYASGLVELNEKKLEMMKIVYENMPKDRNQEGTGIFNSETPEGTNDWEDFISIIDSIVENVPLEDPEVFYKFAPFLLHSEKHKEKLNGMDLRLVYESNNNNLSEHWIKHTDERVGTLRCSFDIDKISDDEIEFCKKFSNLTKVELLYERVDVFDESKTWSNSMKVLSSIPACTEVELNTNNLAVLKCIIDGVTSNSEVVQQLNKLKIVFYSTFGIRYLNSAVEKFPFLVTSLPKLSEITIENQAAIYTPGKDHKSDNLLKLIEKLPTGRDIEINLIGRCIESNERPEFVNALKETPDTVKVCMIYKLDSFNKNDALRLRNLIEHSKLDIKLFYTKNGIERQIPISTTFLDSIAKFKCFHIGSFASCIHVEHTNMSDFLSSFDFFIKEWEWESVNYYDKNTTTEFCQLLLFLNSSNAFKDIHFGSTLLKLRSQDEIDELISVIIKRDNILKLDISNLLIDSDKTISFYKKTKEIRFLSLHVLSWLIRVSNENKDMFIQQLPETYNMLYPSGRDIDEFVSRANALSELDLFTINLTNKDVVYICDNNFDKVLKLLKTNIKYKPSENSFEGRVNSTLSCVHDFFLPQLWPFSFLSQKGMFKKVYIAECKFSEEQVNKLRTEMKEVYGNNIEIVNKVIYVARLFLKMKTSDEN